MKNGGLRPKPEKMNIHHNTKKSMNISLPKHDFRITASCRLKKIFKLPALKFHAGPAGNKLLGLYFLPPRLNGAVCHDFLRNFLRELLQDVDLHTIFMVHA